MEISLKIEEAQKQAAEELKKRKKEYDDALELFMALQNIKPYVFSDADKEIYSESFMKSYSDCYDISALEGMTLKGLYSGCSFVPSILKSCKFFVKPGNKGFLYSTFKVVDSKLELAYND